MSVAIDGGTPSTGNPNAHAHAITGVVGLEPALAAKALAARIMAAGTGLLGGGDLYADRTFAANFGTAAGTVCQGNDARLSDSRTPTAHKTSHENGGSDEISVAGLSGTLADAQTPAAHVLDAAVHTVSGLTPGHFLKATGATAFGFTAHGLAASDVGAFGTANDVDLASGKVLKVATIQVVGAQGATVADATGGVVQDAEARTALNALLARLRTHGLIAT